MRDINDVLPKLPGMKWGALFNWKLDDAEIDEMVRNPPFPSDAKWHSVFKDETSDSGRDVVVDGRLVRYKDKNKLT